jgi:hypothetical protein
MSSCGSRELESIMNGLKRSTCTVESLVIDEPCYLYWPLLEALPLILSLEQLVFSLEHIETLDNATELQHFYSVSKQC